MHNYDYEPLPHPLFFLQKEHNIIKALDGSGSVCSVTN